MTSIETINKAARQATCHPMICVVTEDNKSRCVIEHTDFYALTIHAANDCRTLHFSVPGGKMTGTMEAGVYFHPDLLYDTPLETKITEYSSQCKEGTNLNVEELRNITDCFLKIKEELHHPIDKFSSTILSSQLSLLLNYCVKICN